MVISRKYLGELLTVNWLASYALKTSLFWGATKKAFVMVIAPGQLFATKYYLGLATTNGAPNDCAMDSHGTICVFFYNSS